MRKIILSLSACIVLALSACSANRRAEDDSSAADAKTQSSRTTAPSSSTANTAVATEQPSDLSLIKANAVQPSVDPTGVERKIIRNAELTIESHSPEESFRKVAALAESKGGFVVTSEATQPEGAAEPGRTTVSVTLRIPAAQFDPTVEEIRKVGDRILLDKRTGQDVTEEYIDLQARLQAKRALESQFLEIMKQAQKVSEALEVQRQLAEVRTEIEQVEGRKRFLESQSSLSTIQVTIRPPVQILGTTSGGFKEAFRDGIGAATAVIIVLVKVVLISLPLLLLIGLPAWLITRYWVRRSKRAKLS